MALKHGGNLLQVAARYNSDPASWIDLSTGVSPFTYPLGEIPVSVWNQLPQDNDGLEQAAQGYYRAPMQPLPLAGSQAAIMALPAVISLFLGRCGTVTLPKVGYKEHQHAWSGYLQDNKEWQVEFYRGQPDEKQVVQSDVVLLINPNNPAGTTVSKDYLHATATKLAQKGGWLIVDEAFADSDPQESLVTCEQWPHNLVVLRSVGKFFGLAGARAGFLFAPENVMRLMHELLGPWTVSGPTRWAVKQALVDHNWQKQNRERINQASQRLNALLTDYLTDKLAGTALFTTVFLSDAVQCHHLLCQQQVLTRLCDEENALRFGLPADEAGWHKLEIALAALKQARKEKE
jgi:cobalamin biosynthetic protein CobC